MLTVACAQPVRGQENGESAAANDGETVTVHKTAASLLLRDTPQLEADWTFVSHDGTSNLERTWKAVQMDGELVLVCQGQPYGYLRTRQQFENFQLGLEWRYPADANGNSGILVYTSDEAQVWPRSIQIQLHQPLCGSIFPSGEAKSDNEIREVRDVARPIAQWNTCVISSTNGTLQVEMNGRRVGEVTGCDPRKGGIALQSEGSEIHFRRIWVREIPPPEAPPVDMSCLWPVPPVRREFPAAVFLAPRTVSGCAPVEVIPHRPAHRRLHDKKVSYVVFREPVASHGPVGDCGPVEPVVVDSSRTVPIPVGIAGLSRREWRKLSR